MGGGFMGRGFRRGGGFGFGRGRGFGGAWDGPNAAWAYGPANPAAYGAPYGANPQDEAEYLRREADAIRGDLDTINRRLEELEAKDTQS